MSQALEVLRSPRWTAIYRAKRFPTREVVINSPDKPPARREFHVPMDGDVIFTAVSVTQLNEPKEGFEMATKKRAKKTKKKKEEEEVEELEGLDDLDDEDEDEPDDEDVDADEDEDEDEDEDDDDEEDDEDDEEETPKSKKSKKSKSKKGKKRGPTGPRPMPKGKLSAQDVAELGDTDARTVRLFLRKKANKKRFPKDKELSRYAFSKTEAKEIVKAMRTDKRKSKAKKSEDEDDE